MEQHGLYLIGGHLVITKKLFQFILIAIVALFIQVPTQAATCNKSYTLGFFNGVWNTFGEASEGASKLKDIIGPTYNNEPVKYKTFYNHTAPGYDVLGLQDVAETFIQRAAEIDQLSTNHSKPTPKDLS